MSRVRFKVYSIFTVCALLGATAGTFGFPHVVKSELDARMLALLPGMHVFGMRHITEKYSGPLVSIDIPNQRIVINVADSFPQSERAVTPMEFRFDDATVWSSVEYIFKDDVLERRGLISEQPRNLPEGTLISVFQDHDGREWRTVSIAFLRRTNL